MRACSLPLQEQWKKPRLIAIPILSMLEDIQQKINYGLRKRGVIQSLTFESLICSSTSGQTAAWHFLYSSMHSGRRYSHWPMRRGPWFVDAMMVCDLL